MKAELLLKQRLILSENSFVESVLWRVPLPILGSNHAFKYRLAYICNGICVIRYDNEAGKGDHKHVDDTESIYAFDSPGQLLADFWQDVDHWRINHE